MGLRRAIAELFGGDGHVRAKDGASGPRERKSAAPLSAGAFLLTGEGSGGPFAQSFEALSRTGYMANPVVHRCVRLLGEATGALVFLAYRDAEELDGHPALDLLRRPNGTQDKAAFLERLCGHLMLSGSAYVEWVGGEETPPALFLWRPDRVRAITGSDGWPEAYEYRIGSSLRRIAAEPEGPRPSRLLPIHLFHPLSDQDGFAPLASASAAVELHNAAARWNTALLKNSARPSGALVYKPADGANLSAEQFERLKAELENGYQGASAAGRPMLLEGGLDWKTMALSPKDMDFMEARHGAARDIALAFGVPPMLLGIPGDNTYANYAEANRAFYRLTVLPLARRLCGALGGFLGDHFEEPKLRLDIDLDAVEALSNERDALWERVGKADFLSREEKREAVGFGRMG